MLSGQMNREQTGKMKNGDAHTFGTKVVGELGGSRKRTRDISIFDEILGLYKNVRLLRCIRLIRSSLLFIP